MARGFRRERGAAADRSYRGLARMGPEIAGHSDIKVTMTVYAHGRLDEKAAALTQLESAVAGALPSPAAVTDAQNDQPTS